MNDSKFVYKTQEDLMGICENEDHFIQLAKGTNKSPKMIEESVQKMYEWFKKQPHLEKIKLDRAIVLRYIRNCGWSIEKAKIKLENYFIIKTLYEDFFGKRDTLDPFFESAFMTAHICILPHMTSDKSRITIMGIASPDPKLCNFDHSSRYMYMLSDVRLKIDTNSSEIFIFDMSNFKMGHMMKISPSIRNHMYIMQNCFAIKVVNMHFINCPGYGINAINLVKSALKKKLADRILIHKTIEDLHKYISPELLPSNLGGTQPSYAEIEHAWKDELRLPAWRNWFLEYDEGKSDENKRILKNTFFDEYQSLVGTFRNLNVD